MAKTLTFTGNENKIYDLEQISTTDTRLSTTELKLHVFEYDDSIGEKPVPENTSIGQIWLVKKKVNGAG
jgi:hypothetical protein